MLLCPLVDTQRIYALTNAYSRFSQHMQESPCHMYDYISNPIPIAETSVSMDGELSITSLLIPSICVCNNYCKNYAMKTSHSIILQHMQQLPHITSNLQNNIWSTYTIHNLLHPSTIYYAAIKYIFPLICIGVSVLFHSVGLSILSFYIHFCWSFGVVSFSFVSSLSFIFFLLHFFSFLPNHSVM